MAATNEETTRAKLERLQKLRDEALHASSGKAVERQHAQGKLLARERLLKLLDPGSFVELDRYVRHRESNFGMLERRPWGDAVVTGYGTIFGRKVFVFSQDFTVFGGSLSEVFAEKICKFGCGEATFDASTDDFLSFDVIKDVGQRSPACDAIIAHLRDP